MSNKLSEPDIANDQKQFAELMKEFKNLSPIIEKYKEYQSAENSFTESKELLEEGMQRIYDSGIKAVCVESRPHPDFVGEGWWRDLDIIMAKAKELNMRVWVLDDAHFPSGFCNGKIAPDSPYGKIYLT